MRKNKITGAIPNAGRKGNGKHKVSYKISDEALEVINQQKNKSEFVSLAILAYSNQTE